MADPELEGLRDEISKLRNEILDARVERAAKHLEFMRNWMGIYTPTVTLVFLMFALLGWKGLSDIQTNRDRVESTARRAGELLQDVDNKFTKEEADFKATSKTNEKIVEQNKNVLGGFQTSLDELERKHVELRKTEVQIQSTLETVSGDVQRLSKDVKATSTSLSSSLSLTSGIGGVLSSSLNIPIITSVTVPILGGGELSIQGLGFGSSHGQVLVSLTKPASSNGQFVPTLTMSSSSVELPQAAITMWSDSFISCPGLAKFVTETFHEDFDTRKSTVLIQVIGESGAKSNVYSLVPPPSTAPFITGFSVH